MRHHAPCLHFLFSIAATLMLASCSLVPSNEEPERYSLLTIAKTPLDTPPSDLIDTSSDDTPSDWRAASLKGNADVYLGADRETLCILLIIDPDDGSYLSCRYEHTEDPLYIRTNEFDGPHIAVFATDDDIRSMTVSDVTCVTANNSVAFVGLSQADSIVEINRLDGTSQDMDFSLSEDDDGSLPPKTTDGDVTCA